MQYGVWHIERRDSAERDNFARAALDFCRAVRQLDGVDGCRFYWKPVDTIVIVAEGGSAAAWNVVSTDVTNAQFDLADLGRIVNYEVWLDARSGQDAYVASGRS